MKSSEELQERMDRLRWACQRTQSELTPPLTLFLQQCYPDLAIGQRFAFERLLSAPDTDIADWLNNQAQSRDQGICHIVKEIQQLISEQVQESN